MASSPGIPADQPEEKTQMVQLASFSLPTTSARIKAHTLRYCPSMDLVAAALEDESWNVWRLGGSRVFGGSGFTRDNGIKGSGSGRLGILRLEWKGNGMFLAIACTDNAIRLISTHNGKIVHLLATDPFTNATGICCLGWNVNLTDPGTLPLQSKNGGKSASLEELLGPKAGGSPDGSSAIKPDLPRELALIDVETSFPKLSTLPATGIEDDVFSSKTSLDAMFHGSEGTSPTDSVDVLVAGTENGLVHLKIFDCFEVGKIDLGSAFGVGGCSVLRHASHSMSSVHTFVVRRGIAPAEAEMFLVGVSFRFINLSPRYLSVVAAKSTQLQNLLRYIDQVKTQISLEWKTAQDLPSKFLRNINETLAEKCESDFVTAAYHLVVTGDCYPPLKEFLVDELGERGHKRWEKAMMNGYETIRRLVHECLLPAIERCQIVISRLKGLSAFRKAGGVLGLEHDSLNVVDDTLDCLNLLGHRLLIAISKELREFTAFSKWLRLEIDIQATDPDISNVDDLLERQDSIEHRPVLDYISGAMSDSKVLKYIRVTSWKAEEQSTWAPADPQTGYYKVYKEEIKSLQMSDSEEESQLPKLDDLVGYLKRQCGQIFSQIADSLRKSILISKPVPLPAEFDKNVMDMRIPSTTDVQNKPRSFRTYIAARQTGSDFAIITLPTNPLPNAMEKEQRVVPVQSDTDSIIWDIKFVDDETIMVLRGNSTEARIESWNYSNLDEMTMEVKHIFDFAVDKSKPLALEVNGRKSRRAVCVLFEDRRSYQVFDIDNAVEVEEEPDADITIGDVEMQQD